MLVLSVSFFHPICLAKSPPAVRDVIRRAMMHISRSCGRIFRVNNANEHFQIVSAM